MGKGQSPFGLIIFFGKFIAQPTHKTTPPTKEKRKSCNTLGTLGKIIKISYQYIYITT